MAESDGRRPLSFIEDEQIEIKPSTELIPDEYERKDNENVLVELVYRPTDEEADDLAKHLTNLGFSVNKTTIDKANSMGISGFVDCVNEKTKQKNYDGLLMIFAKVRLKNDELKDIWGSFTSTKCPPLKNKPKIFIFQVLKSGLQADGFLHKDIKTAYDTPAEADILIVYDKISSESSNDFLANFHNHIRDYGPQEDIISLVSLSIGSETRPLVISTMTRKFFFTVNPYRGHHHKIYESHTEIKDNLEKIMKFVKTIPDHKPKEKDKSLMSSFRKTFNSFRKNHPDRESDSGENKKKPEQSETAEKLRKVEKHVSEAQKVNEIKEEPVVEPVKGKSKPIKVPVKSVVITPTKSPGRKSSLSTPVTPTRKTSIRTRNLSGNFNSKEDLSKKPAWK